jgi:hypothetical protein
MPNAVPGANEVVFALRLPLAHVGVMKHDLRLPLTGEADHFCRNIEPFDDKSSFQEQFNEPSTAAAANIESSARAIQELQGFVVRLDAVGTVEVLACPL